MMYFVKYGGSLTVLMLQRIFGFRQWFIDTKNLEKNALESLSDVKFLLESGHESMKSILKARPYWCISRQRVWGVPIPVFFNKYAKMCLFTIFITGIITNEKD